MRDVAQINGLNELETWLRIIIASEMLPLGKVVLLLDECRQLQHTLGSSFKTARKSSRR